MPSSHVKPGDLITADFFNSLLDRLEALEAQGGPAGMLTITALEPATGPYRVGTQLIVRGTNFDFSVGGQRVFVGGQPITASAFKAGSSDTQLVFDMPNLSGVPEAGKEVELLMRNRVSQVTRSITVQPAVLAFNGPVDVQWSRTEPTNIKAGQKTRFIFRARSRGGPAAFTFIPSVTVLPVASTDSAALANTLLQALHVMRMNDEPLTSLDLDSTFTEFAVTADPFPTLPNNRQFRLTVTAATQGTTWPSDDESFTVGQAVEPPDDTITLTVNSAFPPGRFETASNTMFVPGGQQAALQLNVVFAVAGTYTPIITPPTGWTVARGPTTPAQETLITPDTRTPIFAVTAPANGGPVPLVIGYQRQGQTRKQTITVNLAVGN